ncbi:hypothetical protein Mzhil_1191 [Methanosalsum zhilinae DSM 4017]|uniref:Uncharacterized protein n=1 Tax=Methanosalsum zhilinae (strain DSM 4017 / NBRC 107636 / OCM 62 / WeN5) TaxID=679901 RepID=F7XMN1_METZD|nr:hypothetical protein [Methanosalsum zhilinae]AEH61046.1 hypothetical protein Mzhil_1191 [Methanosalsum zhilinae DSM 4017]
MSWWKEQLKSIIQESSESNNYKHPENLNVKFAQFKLRKVFRDIIIPALDELKGEIEKYGRRVVIEVDDTGLNSATIIVYACSEEDRHKEIEEFYFQIKGRAYQKAGFAFPEHAEEGKPRITKVEILLRSGTLAEYDVEEVDKDNIIEVFVEEYSKWINY